MRKLKLIIVFLILSVLSINIQAQHNHEFMLPDNSVIFPHEETGYDWQCSDETQETSIWVGITISQQPNKLGNYAYSVYITSNTYNENDKILDILVGGIDIMYYSHTKYLNNRSDEKKLLQSKDNFKQQMTQEVSAYENKEDLLNFVDGYNTQTLMITHNHILVHTFFLPDRNSDIIVLWNYIKKLEK